MKKLFLVSIILLVVMGFIFGGSTASLTVNGSIAQVLSAEVTPVATSVLNIDSTTGLAKTNGLATVTVITNNYGGYSLTLYSTNLGFQDTVLLDSYRVDYNVFIDDVGIGKASALTEILATEIGSNVSKTTGVGDQYVIDISVDESGADLYRSAIYRDSIVLTVTTL